MWMPTRCIFKLYDIMYITLLYVLYYATSYLSRFLFSINIVLLLLCCAFCYESWKPAAKDSNNLHSMRAGVGIAAAVAARSSITHRLCGRPPSSMNIILSRILLQAQKKLLQFRERKANKLRREGKKEEAINLRHLFFQLSQYFVRHLPYDSMSSGTTD